VTNAASSGSIGTVTYRFEVSELSSFPSDPSRTFAQDGVAQGSGTTSWTIDRDLNPGGTFFWRARATDGTVTSAFSAGESFRIKSVCAFAVSPTSASVPNAGGTVTVTVTTTSDCAWTAVSNDSSLTVTPGSGTGNGTVTITAAANSGAPRSATVTIAGQTVTISQGAAAPPNSSIVVRFNLLDPGTSGGSPTTECRIRGSAGSTTTCVVESTSFPLGTNGLVSYDWTVQYTYDTAKTFTQSGSSPRFSFSDQCGLSGSTETGAEQPLQVTLTVTDNQGNTATATSGSGSQPPLVIRLFMCGF